MSGAFTKWVERTDLRSCHHLRKRVYLLVFQVDKYLKDILQDVISNLTSSTWRVRESRYNYLNLKWTKNINSSVSVAVILVIRQFILLRKTI